MAKSKVLIVEDEKKIRDMCHKTLESEGFQVLEAENGEQATLMLLQDKGIDVFLLDIRMPVVSGPAFFDAVKLYNPNAKVVVSSVYPLERQKELIEGADDYFDKAEGMETLVTRVKSVLKQQKRAA
jgi:DNA-binding response OmpR family regulator